MTTLAQIEPTGARPAAARRGSRRVPASAAGQDRKDARLRTTEAPGSGWPPGGRGLDELRIAGTWRVTW